MKKTMIVTLLALILIISGCSTFFPKDKPIVNTTVVQEHPGEPKHLDLCSFNYYTISKVDSINTNNCLTLINLTFTSTEANNLRNSSQYIGGDIDAIILNLFNETCGKIHNLGKAFCLNDNSNCVIVDGNSCSIVQMIEPSVVNQTNITTA